MTEEQFTAGVSLREYIEQRLHDVDRATELRKESVDARVAGIEKAIDLRLGGMDKAQELASNVLEARLEAMNEFRAAMGDQCGHYITREYYEARHGTLETQIAMLNEARAEGRGKASMTAVYVAWLFGAIGIIMGVVDLLRK